MNITISKLTISKRVGLWSIVAVGTVAIGAVLVSPSGCACKSNPSAEARAHLGAWVKAQKTHYLEKKKFSTTWDDLQLGIPSETNTYLYRTIVLTPQSIAAVAIPKQADKKGYSVRVTVQENTVQTDGKRETVLNFPDALCEAVEPGLRPATIPQVTPNGRVNCGRDVDFRTGQVGNAKDG